MQRSPWIGLGLAVSSGLLMSGRAALAGDAPAPAPAPAPPAAPAAPQAPSKPLPPLATNAQAKEALLAFKEAYKAKDSASKADAVDGLGKINHPDVVQELVRLTKNRDLEVRAAAFQNLAMQRAIPSLVGRPLLSTVDVKSQDWQYVTDVIDTVKGVGDRAALPTLVKLLKHENPSVVRWSLDALGDMKEVRAIDAILDLMKELKIDQAAKWEGGEVHVDTGASGDADQRSAEAAYAAKYGNGTGKGKAGGRKTRSLGDVFYLVLKDLTGQSFASGEGAKDWLAAHKPEIEAKKAALDDEQKKQDAAGKAAVVAARTGP